MSITHERLLQLVNYDPETGVFTNNASRKGAPAGAKTGSPKGNGYLELRLDYKAYLAHRLAWFYVHKEWPKGHIDHINHNRQDNRIANLRDVTQAVNNAKGPNHDGKLGVFGIPGVKMGGVGRKSLIASLTVDYKSKHLGTFQDLKSAYESYSAAKLKYHSVVCKSFEDYGVENLTLKEAYEHDQLVRRRAIGDSD